MDRFLSWGANARAWLRLRPRGIATHFTTDRRSRPFGSPYDRLPSGFRK
jgi:hypothetical protein